MSQRDQSQGDEPDEGAEGSCSTSRSLLVRLKGHESAAWDRLVSLYAPLVLHWLRRADLPPQDITDVFQEVFQSVAANIDRFRKDKPEDTFRGWLRTITRNKANDHFRRLQREPAGTGGTEANLRFSQLAAADPEKERDDEDRDEVQAYNQIVQRALESIRCDFETRTWQAFWQIVVDGKAPGDVATDLAMSPGAVRVAKSRVLQRLRQELGDLLD